MIIARAAARWEILIMFGATEEMIVAQLKEAGTMSPDTKIHENQNL